MKREKRYKLTEQGEGVAVELLGGLDVLNVVACFMHIIKTRGNLISNEGYEPDIKTYMELGRVVQLMKLYDTWDILVKECENCLEQESKYFETNPHSGEYEVESIDP